MITIAKGLRCRLELFGLNQWAIYEVMQGGHIAVYSGPVPLCADSGIYCDNALLATIYATGKEGIEWTGPVLRSGTAAFFRWEMEGDDGFAHAGVDAIRLQGVIGQHGIGDIKLASTDLYMGMVLTINPFQVAFR